MLVDYKTLFVNTKFPFLWLSQILSQLTINIMNFLLLIKIFNETGSSIATSFLWISYALPAVVIGPFAAASVDLLDRKKVMLITNLLQSLTLLFYAFFFEGKLFLLFGVVITYSLFNQFYIPAESASLPTLVKKESLAFANGLFFLTQQISVIIGFGVAGTINSLIGFKNSIIISSFFIFLAFIFVNFLPKMKPNVLMPPELDKAVIKFFSRIKEGYDFIKKNKNVLVPFLLLMGIHVSLSIIIVNVPVLATDLFKIDVNSAGLFIVVPAGFGALVSAVSVPKLLKKGWRKKKVIDVSLFLLILIFFYYTFILPEFQTPFKIFSILATFLAGISYVGILIPSQTFLQEVTPGGLRGRVFGNYWFLVTVATIFPVIFSGAVSELLGIRYLLVLLGTLSMMAFGYSIKRGNDLIMDGFNPPSRKSEDSQPPDE